MNSSIQKPPQEQDKTIRSLLEGENFKHAVSKALPKHLSADRFVRIALTALTRTPKLAQCEKASFFNALLTLSQLGLEPDGRLAHLIPFENRRREVTECQLIVDYKGLVDLAMRSGNVSNIHADKICENDEFDYDRGQIVRHKINFRKPRGEAYAYYALVRFKDGTEKCEVLPKEDVNSIRARSKAGNSGPWVTDYDEMAKKTAFRRLTKWIQLSPEFRDALEADADSLDEKRFEAAKPVFSQEHSFLAPQIEKDNISIENEQTAPTPQAPVEDPEFNPDTPQKELQLAVIDTGVGEAKFMAAFKKQAPSLVGKAKMIYELSDAAASEAIKDIDALVQLAEVVK